MIRSLIVRSAVAVMFMLIANLPGMIVAIVMVSMMNMAMFGVRVRVDNEASEYADRSGQGLADPWRDCEDKRKQPNQVGTASACSLQWDQHA